MSASCIKWGFSPKDNRSKEEPTDPPVEASLPEPVRVGNLGDLIRKNALEPPSTKKDIPPSDSFEDDGGCLDAPQDICNLEQAIWQEVNQKRIEQNRRPLKFRPKLAYVAREWSKTLMQSGQALSHEGFPKERNEVYKKRFQEDGLELFLAENLASLTGPTDPSQIAQVLVEQWLNSPGHRRNLLDSSFQGTGLGVAKSGNSVIATQIFTYP